VWSLRRILVSGHDPLDSSFISKVCSGEAFRSGIVAAVEMGHGGDAVTASYPEFLTSNSNDLLKILPPLSNHNVHSP
jgi:hypothetical protein